MLQDSVRVWFWLMSFALWQGGFMFYGAVVVPIGSDFLQSDLMQGFITQRVTRWLNAFGMICLLVSPAKRTVIRLFCFLFIGQCILIALHHEMSDLLEVNEYRITDPSYFRQLHISYLLMSTIVWMCACLWLFRLIPTKKLFS